MKYLNILILISYSFFVHGQKYDGYKDCPDYLDTVSVYSYTLGYIQQYNGLVYEKENSIKINCSIDSNILNRCKKKLFSIPLHLDSATFVSYKIYVDLMIKSIGLTNGVLKDKNYLQVFKFPNSICSLLKTGHNRFFIGTYYYYSYLENNIQESQKAKNTIIKSSSGTGNTPEKIGSQRSIYFFVIDLETQYPIYIQAKQSQFYRAYSPRKVDLALDLYPFRHFFRKVKKK